MQFRFSLRHRLVPLLGFLAAGLPAAAPAPGAETHPFSVRDMVAMERIGDPKPSPDGRWVVFTRRVWEESSDKITTSLWLAALDGSGVRRLTAARNVSDTSPAFSPDSKYVAFVSNRSGSSQIWAIALEGGEAAQISSFPVDVDNLEWSPDGTRLAFSAEVYAECADLACTAKRDQDKEADPAKVKEFDALMIRHWDSWYEGKRNHLFTVALKGPGFPVLAGDPVDLLKGIDHDAPTKPFGGTEEFAFSPDGKEIAFTSKMDNHEATSTDTNIYVVPAAGGAPACLTEANKATDTSPVYSPDGSQMSWLAMSRPGYESDRQRVVVYDRRSKISRVITEPWDRSPGSIAFTPDGKSLVVTAGDAARVPIFLVDAASGKVTKAVSDHFNSSVSVARPAGAASSSGGQSPASAGAGRLVFLQDSLTFPAEVFTSRLDGTDLRRLTHVNDDRVAAARISTPEEFWFRGSSGANLHGWILKPVDFKEGSKYPVAFLVHGGPQGSWEDHFHYRWNPQAYAGAGYVTVAIDPTGSTGYGQELTDGIRGDWGGKPYQDLMLGLDTVLQKFPYTDASRVGALGASYGGYMIYWIAGQTERFKCLVSHDGTFDTRSGYFATEELWFPEWEFLGTPWERPDLYDKWSPSHYVDKWKTPMLVVHGAKDFRLPETEGFGAFTVLQRRGIPSKLLYFPTESHWVLKAKDSIRWHDEVIAWLDRWLKPGK